MADDAKLKCVRDGSSLSAPSLSAPYEIRYRTEKFDITAAELRDTIKKVGNSAEAVEKELAG